MVLATGDSVPQGVEVDYLSGRGDKTVKKIWCFYLCVYNFFIPLWERPTIWCGEKLAKIQSERTRLLLSAILCSLAIVVVGITKALYKVPVWGWHNLYAEVPFFFSLGMFNVSVQIYALEMQVHERVTLVPGEEDNV